MPTALERAIESLADHSVPLPSALRGVLIVARRISARELSEWLVHELDGYEGPAPLPAYRRATGVPVNLVFRGPFQSEVHRSVSRDDLPAELRSIMDSVALRAPLAELEALARSDGDPGLEFPMVWVQRYRDLAEQGRAMSMEMMVLDGASARFPRTNLLGILDRIRTTALDLALSLEDVSPEVGTQGGPSVATSPELAAAVRVGVMNVFGEGARVTVAEGGSLAVGDSATAVSISPGDIDALLAAASNYLGVEGIEALAEALEQDGNEAGTATRGVMEKVKAGAYGLAGGLATNAAYDGVLELLKMAFPGFGG